MVDLHDFRTFDHDFAGFFVIARPLDVLVSLL